MSSSREFEKARKLFFCARDVACTWVNLGRLTVSRRSSVRVLGLLISLNDLYGLMGIYVCPQLGSNFKHDCEESVSVQVGERRQMSQLHPQACLRLMEFGLKLTLKERTVVSYVALCHLHRTPP